MRYLPSVKKDEHTTLWRIAPFSTQRDMWSKIFPKVADYFEKCDTLVICIKLVKVASEYSCVHSTQVSVVHERRVALWWVEHGSLSHVSNFVSTSATINENKNCIRRKKIYFAIALFLFAFKLVIALIKRINLKNSDSIDKFSAQSKSQCWDASMRQMKSEAM